ncbi:MULTISPECIES: AMP-binding protein [unclassified Dietzia]|uniref:AMP-binding protein n=1 Tax=unclassified Dietzia TaxID=2617939 RepID=UPI0015F80BAE|nr:acyl-CoA synthetase [Dietzia sp. Cai40]MBB1045133.1 acyl-CoA synthetase [Dietzia sp. DQ11-44]
MYPGRFAITHPDKPAVIEDATGRVVTYSELEARSVRFANWLLARGLRPGDHIAALSVNDATVFELYWGAMRCGLYFTMVNTHLATDEVAYIVADSGARVLVVSGALAELGESIVDQTPHVEHRLAFAGEVPGHLDYTTTMAEMSTTPPADQPRGADMLYSSGTTGRPKGIKPALDGAQVGDEPGPSLVARMKRNYGFDDDTVYMSPAPIYHAAPLRYATGTQAHGGTVILMDRFDPEHCLAGIEKYGVTHSQWVPTHFIRMLRLPQEVRESYDVSSMRVAIHAAAPCPVEIKKAMLDWWGPVIYEYYSSTESNGATTISPDEWLRKPGSVGRVGQGSSGIVHICDELGAELPAGEDGWIYFERDDYSFEYHNDPGKTAETRHPDHQNWTTLGDIGHLDEDGYLYLTDRAKFTIISGGVNIYPQEIENCIAVHPDVIDVAVIGVPDEVMGQSVKAVVQLVPGVEPSEATAERIKQHCLDRIARYKCPRTVAFTEVIPRTQTGKLVKGRLDTSV